MYALNLAEDGRILSVTYEQYAAPGQPIVDALPDWDVTEFKFEKGKYIHDPLPATKTKSRSEPEEMFMLTKSQYEKVLKLIGEGTK